MWWRWRNWPAGSHELADRPHRRGTPPSTNPNIWHADRLARERSSASSPRGARTHLGVALARSNPEQGWGPASRSDVERKVQLLERDRSWWAQGRWHHALFCHQASSRRGSLGNLGARASALGTWGGAPTRANASRPATSARACGRRDPQARARTQPAAASCARAGIPAVGPSGQRLSNTRQGGNARTDSGFGSPACAQRSSRGASTSLGGHGRAQPERARPAESRWQAEGASPLSNGRAREVAAVSLHLPALTAINHLLGIQTEPGDFSDGLINRLAWCRLDPV
jgi:hypothetical protein